MASQDKPKKRIRYFTSTTPTAVRVLVTAYVTFLAFSAWTTSFILQLITYPLAYLLLDKYQLITFMGSIFRRSNVFFMSGWLNPFWRQKYIGKRTGKWNGPRIAMCNHLSNTDPFTVCSSLLPNETKYIVKGDLFKVPIGGWTMALAGDVPIHFTSAKGGWGTKKGAVGKMMRHCKDLLQHGLNICVFPEGIRSKTGLLSEFKDGMFMLAIETDTPIMPCAISGCGKFWAVGDALMDYGTSYCSVGEPIYPTGKTVSQLKEEVKKEILRLKSTFPESLEPKEVYTQPADLSVQGNGHMNGHSSNGQNSNGMSKRS